MSESTREIINGVVEAIPKGEVGSVREKVEKYQILIEKHLKKRRRKDRGGREGREGKKKERERER